MCYPGLIQNIFPEDPVSLPSDMQADGIPGKAGLMISIILEYKNVGQKLLLWTV
jgi:hypothetical protein